MKWIFSFLLLGLFSIKNTPTTHDFHISKCLIEYNENAQAIQFSLHLFIDDVALALAEEYKEKLHLCTKLEVENAETYLFDYLQEKIQIQIDDKPLIINLKKFSNILLITFSNKKITVIFFTQTQLSFNFIFEIKRSINLIESFISLIGSIKFYFTK